MTLKEILNWILAVSIIVLWLPISIPLIMVGVLVRLSAASVIFGYEMADFELKSIAKGFYRRKL